jgi:3-isopropylmalate dehydrogenase
MLLEHLGLDKAASRVEQAVAADLAERAGRVPRSTAEIGDALAARVAG